MANDRHEEAIAVMAKYHGEGDRDSPIVQLEFREMMEDISITGSDKRWWDYRELVNSKEVRYRSMLVVAMGMFSLRSAFSETLADSPGRILWSMVRQRPSILLLSTNACRRRCLEQPYSAPSARPPERCLVCRCRYRRDIHRQMGPSSAVACLGRLYCRNFRAHHGPQCHEHRHRRLWQPDRQEPTTGQSRDCNHLHLRLHLRRGLHSPPGLVPRRVSPV